VTPFMGYDAGSRVPPTASKPKRNTSGPRSSGKLQRIIDEAVRGAIRASLQEHQGNVTVSAGDLGVTPAALWRRMKRLRIGLTKYRR